MLSAIAKSHSCSIAADMDLSKKLTWLLDKCSEEEVPVEKGEQDVFLLFFDLIK